MASDGGSGPDPSVSRLLSARLKLLPTLTLDAAELDAAGDEPSDWADAVDDGSEDGGDTVMLKFCCCRLPSPARPAAAFGTSTGALGHLVSRNRDSYAVIIQAEQWQTRPLLREPVEALESAEPDAAVEAAAAASGRLFVTRTYPPSTSFDASTEFARLDSLLRRSVRPAAVLSEPAAGAARTAQRVGIRSDAM